MLFTAAEPVTKAADTVPWTHKAARPDTRGMRRGWLHRGKRRVGTAADPRDGGAQRRMQDEWLGAGLCGDSSSQTSGTCSFLRKVTVKTKSQPPQA